MTSNEAANIVQAADKAGHVNTSTLLIGVTGSGKTTLLATAAEYLYETYGEISGYYFADLGGYPDRMNALIHHGIVRVFRMRTRGMDLSFETAQLSSMGYWPAQVLDPMTGEVPYGVPMIPPVRRLYHQTCTCGHTRTLRAKSQLAVGNCPNCSQRIAVAATKVVEEQSLTPGLDKIRMRMYDGLTSFSEWYLQDLSKRSELAGEMGAIGGVVNSGDLSFRGNNRAQVGFAQTRAHELVSNSLSIPHQRIMPLWTALTDETSDQGGRLTIVGPKLAGSAKTEIAGAWFGNTLEAATVEGEKPGSKVRRLYLNEFIDAEGRRHILKHRSDPRYVPEYLEDAPYSPGEPPQEICTNFSLGVFFRHLQIADAKALEAVAARFPNAPGLASMPLTLDLGLSDPAPAPTPQAPAAPGLKRPAGGGLKRPAAVPKSPVPTGASTASAPPVTAPAPASSPGEAETVQDTVTAAAPAEEPKEEPREAQTAPAAQEAPAAPPAPAVEAQAPQQTQAPAPSAPATPPPAPPPAQRARAAWPSPPGVKPGTARPLPAVRRPAAPTA